MPEKAKGEVSLFVSILFVIGVLIFYAFLPILYLVYFQIIGGLWIIPLYFGIAWVSGIEFSFATYFLWFITISWVWDSVKFIQMFVTEIVLGVKSDDKKNSLLGLEDIQGISIFLFCAGMSILYLNPVVLYLNQSTITTETITPVRALLVAIDQFLDVSTLNLLSNYDLHLTAVPKYKENIFAQTYTFLTNAGFSIVTIALVWGGLRAYLKFIATPPPAEEAAVQPEPFADPLDRNDYLHDEVRLLEDLSLTFVRRWVQSNERQYMLISNQALTALSNIVAYLLPEAESRLEAAEAAGARDWSAFDKTTANWTGPISEDWQKEEVFSQPMGSAMMPTLFPAEPVSLSATLGLLSRRDPERVGFRIEKGRHMVLFGIKHSGEKPPGVLEMDLNQFCETCMLAIGEL